MRQCGGWEGSAVGSMESGNAAWDKGYVPEVWNPMRNSSMFNNFTPVKKIDTPGKFRQTKIG